MEPAQEGAQAVSGFALHAGRLLDQYAGLTRQMSPSHRYEATLTLSVLQFLLTNCMEVYDYLRTSKKRSALLGVLYEGVDALLEEPDVDVISLFPGSDGRKPKAVLENIRDALSHPTVRVAELGTTGYHTVKDDSGLVTRLRFTSSPDRNTGGNLKQVVEGVPRVFTIEVPLFRLTSLAQLIALVLGQPALDNWDSADLIRPPDLG